MPSTPTAFYGVLRFASVPSLHCTLEVKKGKARINSGGWYTLPAMVIDGQNQLAIESHYDGVFNLSFNDYSKIFNDVDDVENQAAVQQSANLVFTNLSQIPATVDLFTASQTTTAIIETTVSHAAVLPLGTASFDIKRTPKTPLYWGDMHDGGAISMQVIYA